MSFEQLVSSQYALGKEIGQIIENCKKAPKDRRTSQFYSGKIKRLQELGDELYKNNEKLEAYKLTHIDDSYFADAYFAETNKTVMEYIKKLETQALEVDPNSQSVKSTKNSEKAEFNK